LVEELVHLATWMPFTPAAKHLKRSTRVDLSEPTVRRHTEAAGAAYVVVQTAAAERILRDGPDAPCAPAAVVVSVDGAMVPLQHGVWAEAKTLVIGEVERPPAEADLHTLSYFSRVCDAATFGEAAVVETHRRGVAAAEQVAAVVDGAEWIQGFLDVHCPDAVRILDFPHAVEHLNQVGQAVLGAGTPEATAWLTAHRHTLKHDGPTDVLSALHSLVATHPAADGWQEDVAYLEKRVAQMQYPTYAAAGWPLGSGVVESANKVVVEARLKGAGMHWARAQVDPMLALRNIVYNDRWDEAWGQITTELRAQEHQARRARSRQRRLRAAGRPDRPCPELPSVAPDPTPVVAPAPVPLHAPGVAAAPQEAWRPAADHPWRRAWSTRRQAEQAHAA
jgi:hypothetical protein